MQALLHELAVAKEKLKVSSRDSGKTFFAAATRI